MKLSQYYVNYLLKLFPDKSALLLIQVLALSLDTFMTFLNNLHIIRKCLQSNIII